MERLGPRARRLPRAQPAARLRPHDRLGPGRSARARRRARHQLHRAHRRAALDRPRGRARRCRRSTSSAISAAAACSSPSAWSCALLERALRQGPGRRRVDGRRRGAPDDDVLRHARHRRRGRDERGTNLLDTGAHFYDVYETRGRQVHLDRLDRAAVLRGAPAPEWSRKEKLPDQNDRPQWPALKRRVAE